MYKEAAQEIIKPVIELYWDIKAKSKSAVKWKHWKETKEIPVLKYCIITLSFIHDEVILVQGILANHFTHKKFNDTYKEEGLTMNSFQVIVHDDIQVKHIDSVK